MHKVVIERPRGNPGRATNGRRANLPDELQPKFESMKRQHRARKWQTDLLGPLKRWLQSQVGRPWNDVYSEACAVIKPDSIIRAHVKTHLLEFVLRHTFMHKGEVSFLDLWGGICPVLSEQSRWRLFYIHPETGILEAIPRKPRSYWTEQEPQPPVTEQWINNRLARKQIRGLWFECHFEVVPVDGRFKRYDHALERVVLRNGLARRDAHYFLCVCKRQLSKRELRDLKLRNIPAPSDKAQSSASPLDGWLKTALLILAGRRSWLSSPRRQRFDSVLPCKWRWCSDSTSGIIRGRSLARAFLMGRRHRVISHWFDSNSPDHIGA